MKTRHSFVQGWILPVITAGVLMVPARHAHAVIANIKASYPENYSVELGLVLPADSWGGGSWNIGTPGERGPTVSYEAGTHARRVHLGYGERSTAGWYAVRLTGFFMWEEDHRYIGIQGFVSLFGACGAVGVMRRTDKDSYRATVGIGLGW